MATMSDLSVDLVAKILSRVPLTSLRAVRSTCNVWNDLSKNQLFGEAARKQFLGFMMTDLRVFSMKFDLQGIRSNDDFVDPSMKQVSIRDRIKISRVLHCDGLLLCTIKGNSSQLVVWNPYLGQIRWIRPRSLLREFHVSDRLALGYDNKKKNRNHKILRSSDVGYEIYDFNSNSWRVPDVTRDGFVMLCERGFSLKGNAYFYAQEEVDDITRDFLLCFDFTREKFGRRLSMPYPTDVEKTVTLSCVRDEQLAVLYQHYESPCEIMHIWITTEIAPNKVSWSKFLKVELLTLNGFPAGFKAGSFFIDEEKKVAVVFNLDGYERTETCGYQTAYVCGQDGYFKAVNVREEADESGDTRQRYHPPVVCSSYVPSLVPLQINRKRKERDC